MTNTQDNSEREQVAAWMESLGFKLVQPYRNPSVRTWRNDSNPSFYPTDIGDDFATYMYRLILADRAAQKEALERDLIESVLNEVSNDSNPTTWALQARLQTTVMEKDEEVKS